jgi:hypothetical protein
LPLQVALPQPKACPSQKAFHAGRKSFPFWDLGLSSSTFCSGM